MTDTLDRHERESHVSIGVAARTILEHPDLASVTLCAGHAGLDRVVTHPRVQKSGLVLVGHTRGIIATRVQVLGETEITFLEGLDPVTRDARVAFLFSLNFSMVVITRGIAPLAELRKHADLTSTPLVVSSVRSSSTINILHGVLDRLLAPRATVHGVFVEVHGVGTLLLGPSGIGKSECALFLVERGHRLVADDQVQLTCLPNGAVMGAPPPLLRNHLEIRGVGILNIRDLFGATAVREEARVDMVVELCPFRDDEDYERLGLDEVRAEILGQKLPKLRIPVRPGRDMGVILEMAARNQLLKREGVHGARRFVERLERGLNGSDDSGE